MLFNDMSHFCQIKTTYVDPISVCVHRRSHPMELLSFNNYWLHGHVWLVSSCFQFLDADEHPVSAVSPDRIDAEWVSNTANTVNDRQWLEPQNALQTDFRSARG